MLRGAVRRRGLPTRVLSPRLRRVRRLEAPARWWASSGGPAPASPQRLALAFPALAFLARRRGGGVGVAVDLVTEICVVGDRSPDQRRRRREVVGGGIDIAVVRPQRLDH